MLPCLFVYPLSSSSKNISNLPRCIDQSLNSLPTNMEGIVIPRAPGNSANTKSNTRSIVETSNGSEFEFPIRTDGAVQKDVSKVMDH